jgi:hypothetical protein
MKTRYCAAGLVSPVIGLLLVPRAAYAKGAGKTFAPLLDLRLQVRTSPLVSF